MHLLLLQWIVGTHLITCPRHRLDDDDNDYDDLAGEDFDQLNFELDHRWHWKGGVPELTGPRATSDSKCLET